jgi:glycosyltransferase involved in cell wall biosynthesis
MIETAILHYSAPPVVGGVEAVIEAHAETFRRAGYPVAIIAGRGDSGALPEGTEFVQVPEIDSRHPQVVRMAKQLEQGQVPSGFDSLVSELVDLLAPDLCSFDNVIVHNVFTKHFNLPLTAALHRMLDAGTLRGCIAWCHDFTWTSANSRSRVHPGYPWDLLRTFREDVTYVVVSQQRREALAGLFDCPREEIRVIYNGVDPQTLLGLSTEGQALINRLGILDSDLVMLMPVRVTQAKNIEQALRVVSEIKARGHRPKLILTGPPDPHDVQSMAYFESLRRMRSELGVEGEMRFVFESGPDAGEPYTVEMTVVGDLFRVSDLVFMPSHREGFGMPVLEAGLAGLPVFSTPIPATQEIGREDVNTFDWDQEPGAIADQILGWAESSPVHRLRRRVRRKYTWQAIFERDIKPLLDRSKHR